jgi:phosphoribosylformylglycinamidine cyclo-ligase
MTKPLTYADAGVDIDKADEFVGNIKKIAKQTFRSGVISEIGGFGGMFSLNITNMESPVLVSSTDGVGTKLKIAFMLGKHDTVGIDLVAMCVNDIVVQGAKPLFFLDYLSMGKLEPKIATDVITGLVENSKIIDGSGIHVGDQLIGISSSGLHSNGYSLVRKICFEILGLKVDHYVPEFGKTIGEELLTPTRIYSETIHRIIKDLPVFGLAHITGGGITDNIVRVIPEGCSVILRKNSWDMPPVFEYLKRAGNISAQEMMRTFNNGIGMVAVVHEKNTQEILDRLIAMKENAFVIGEVIDRKDSEERVKWV